MEILYQDDRVVVCVKPAGVLSTDEPGGLPSLLRHALGDENAVVKSVHRLDRTVGGVMVYARTRRAAADLGEQIASGRFHKEYLAVVHGAPSVREGTLRDWLCRDTRTRRTYVAAEGTAGSREAVLDYRALTEAEDMTLLSVTLRTGRTHQIRCQLAQHGYPIVGDRKYGRDGDACGVALWSHTIGFIHPRTGEQMLFMREPADVFPWGLVIP